MREWEHSGFPLVFPLLFEYLSKALIKHLNLPLPHKGLIIEHLLLAGFPNQFDIVVLCPLYLYGHLLLFLLVL
jgi:hypothetical protein